MGIRDFIKLFLLILAVTATITGCAGSPTLQPDATTGGEKHSSEASATAEIPDRSELRPVQTLSPGLEHVETPEVEPVVGEVPEEILVEIVADLVERTGAAREDVRVVKAEAVVWNDGALGCPKPGEFYIQMLINGYWVVLEIEGTAYDYRVSDKGYFTLCEGRGGLPISPPGNPETGPSPDQ